MAAILLLPVLGSAQNYVFGPNVRVNDDSPGSSYHNTYSPGQHLIAARGDTVYLVWRGDQTGGSQVYFSRSNDGGSAFLPAVQVDRTWGGCQALAVDDSGNVHVSWLNGNISGYCFTYYAKSTDGGRTFLPPVRACDSLYEDQYGLPTIAVSRDGRCVYVVRTESGEGAHPSYIMLGRSLDGGATFVVPDVRINTDTVTDKYDPTLAVLGDSIVLVAWRDNPGIAFRRSTDAGASFGSVVTLSDDRWAAEPSIGADSMGWVYVRCGDTLGMRISRDTGKTFTPAGGPSGANTSVYVTLDGRLYVAWSSGGWYGKVHFSHSTDHGASFTAPVRSSNGPDDYWEDWPTVTANEVGQVFMAWSDTRNDPNKQNSDIYFATGQPAAVEELREPPALADVMVFPNPTLGRVWLKYSLRRPGRVVTKLLDATGRQIAVLSDGNERAGHHVRIWSGLDAEGRRVGAGVYFMRLTTPEGNVCKKVQVMSE